VTRWICPRCEREFDRARQSHTCVPGNTVAETFAGGREWQRPICDAVIAYVEALGPLHVDAVGVGVFLKHQSKFAELRPMARALSLSLVLPRPVEHDRFTRRPAGSAHRFWHFVRLADVAEVDEQVRDWLTESYLSAS
jgi:hypothetical protein